MKAGLESIIKLIKRLRDRSAGFEEALNDAAELERLFEQYHREGFIERVEVAI